MRSWTTNLAKLLLVVTVCTADTSDQRRLNRRKILDDYEDVEVSQWFGFDSKLEASQEFERFLEFGGSLSMSVVVPSVRSISKNGRSKSNKKGSGKSKDGKVRKGKSKDGKSPDGKEGEKKIREGKSKSTGKTRLAKADKRRRVLGIGFSQREAIGKQSKAKAGKAKLGKKEKRESLKESNKLSLPTSPEDLTPKRVPYALMTLAPTPSPNSDSKSISKGKFDSARYRVRRRRRRAQTSEDPITWKSNRREFGDHCLIGTPNGAPGSESGSKPGSKEGSKSGNRGGSKEGSKYGSKEGSKSGNKRVEVRDKGHRRTELGLYACTVSGSWTCCKEYGDMGDDPVCCKGDYTDSFAVHEKPIAHKPLLTDENDEEDDNGPLLSVKKSDTSPSNGPKDVLPSYSNDVPPALTSPGFAAPLLTRPHQDPAAMAVQHSWHSNDNDDGKN